MKITCLVMRFLALTFLSPEQGSDHLCKVAILFSTWQNSPFHWQDLDKFMFARSPAASQISLIEIKVIGDQCNKGNDSVKLKFGIVLYVFIRM